MAEKEASPNISDNLLGALSISWRVRTGLGQLWALCGTGRRPAPGRVRSTPCRGRAQFRLRRADINKVQPDLGWVGPNSAQCASRPNEIDPRPRVDERRARLDQILAVFNGMPLRCHLVSVGRSLGMRVLAFALHSARVTAATGNGWEPRLGAELPCAPLETMQVAGNPICAVCGGVFKGGGEATDKRVQRPSDPQPSS